MARPQPDPATVETLLDTTWRVAAVETARTDALDRKASTLATFSSLLTSLTATLGLRFIENANALWALLLFWVGLAALVLSVALAVRALLMSEYMTFGMTYLRAFPTRGEILKPPEAVRAEVMRGLLRLVSRERRVNNRAARTLRQGFVTLLFGLVLIAAEAGVLATMSVL